MRAAFVATISIFYVTDGTVQDLVPSIELVQMS